MKFKKKNEPEKKQKQQEKKAKKEEKTKEIVIAMEKARLYEYALYSEHPFQLLLMNFLIGLFRGLGSTVGLAIVLMILYYLFKEAIRSDIPYLSEILENLLNQYNQFK